MMTTAHAMGSDPMTKNVIGSDPILETRGVTMRFGGLAAVKSLSMQVPRGALYGLIGPNGAGKTTVFNVLTGVYCPTEGEIDFDGARVDGKKPYEITRLGVARTFQNIRLFADMTVLQNVMTARHLRSRQLLADAVLGATTLTILPEALRSFDQQFPGLRMVIYALLLILLMIFRPQGLLGRREFSWRMFQRARAVKKPVLE